MATASCKRNRISLDDKMKIFEKFSETGGKVKYKTEFEGYPIGIWAAKIRYKLEDNKRFKLTSDERIILERCGALKENSIFDSDEILVDEEEEKRNEDISIEELDFSEDTYDFLRKKGVRNLKNLYMFDLGTFNKRMPENAKEEIMTILQENGTPLDELDLSYRAEKALKNRGVSTIESLKYYSRETIKNINNVGEKTEREIHEKLIEYEKMKKEKDQEESAKTEIEYLRIQKNEKENELTKLQKRLYYIEQRSKKIEEMQIDMDNMVQIV